MLVLLKLLATWGTRWRFVVQLRPICQWIDPRTLKVGECLITYRVAEKSSAYQMEEYAEYWLSCKQVVRGVCFLEALD